MKRAQRIKGYLLVIASAVIFGCMPLLVKGIYADGVNSLSAVLLRNLLSLPAAGLLALRQRGSLRLSPNYLPSVAAVGVMGCILAPLLLFSSYLFLASGVAMVFHFVYPAAVVLGGVLCFRERLTAGNALGVGLCVAGVCLFYTPGYPLDWRGCTLALASGAAYAAYVLLLAHFPHRQQVTGFTLNFYMFAINSGILLAICLIGNWLTLPATFQGWLLSILLALAVNVGAVTMFQQGAFLIGGPQASVLSTLEPITGVLLGAAVFREPLTGRTVLGTLLVILAGISIVFFEICQENGKGME